MTNPQLNYFKDIITADEIEDQILSNLNAWMPSYIAEVCRQRSIDPSGVPSIKSWVTLQKFRHEPQNQTPAIVIVSAGTTGRPTHNGEGWWRSAYLIGISAIISARDQHSSAKMSKLYAAAVRAIMLQQKQGMLYTDVAWIGETFDDLDIGSTDMLAAGTGTFEVVVDGLVKSVGAGPPAPTLVDPGMPSAVEDHPGRITVTEKE